jgi:hypothetical protein
MIVLNENEIVENMLWYTGTSEEPGSDLYEFLGNP